MGRRAGAMEALRPAVEVAGVVVAKPPDVGDLPVVEGCSWIPPFLGPQLN